MSKLSALPPEPYGNFLSLPPQLLHLCPAFCHSANSVTSSRAPTFHLGPLGLSSTGKPDESLLNVKLAKCPWWVQPGSLCYSLCFYVFLFFSSVQLLSHVRLFATPRISAHQASLSITNSRSSPRLTSIESVMPSSHLILCCALLLPPPIPSSIRVFSNESTLHMRWPKYWSFNFSIIPSKEHPGLIFKMDWLDLLAVQETLKSFSNMTVQKHQFFGAQLSS